MEAIQVLNAAFLGLGAGLIALALAHMPQSRLVWPLHAFVAAGVLWAVGDIVATSAADDFWKQTGLVVLYSGTIWMPACWWLVVLRWAEEQRAGLPLRSRVFAWGPFAYAGLMWAAMLTNPWHGSFIEPVIGGRNVYHPLWYAMALPSYALILGALVVELAVMRRIARAEVRRQGTFLVAASLVTLVGNLLYVTDVVSVSITPIVLSASATLLVVGMSRQGLFGVLPSALREIATRHPDGLVVVGPGGRVRFANARAHDLLDPLPLSPNAPFAAVLRDPRLQRESGPAFAELEDPVSVLVQGAGVRVRLGRPPRWLQLSASPVRGRLGRTRGYGVRIVDTTAEQEIERKTRQSRRLESAADLARSLSSEFQGALALVESNAELLGSDVAGRPDAERRLSRIVTAARHGSNLAQQLRLYTGSLGTTRVVLELSDVAQESCDLLEGELPAGVRIVLDRADRLLPIDVDAIQIRHCVYEVLRNAMESMAGSRGDVRISTGAASLDPAALELVCGGEQPVGPFAWVRVRDDGGGMDPETEERAFEPFYSTRGKDRGFGLPTVLGIARAHDALVELRNECGRGCEITLYFPLEPLEPEARAG